MDEQLKLLIEIQKIDRAINLQKELAEAIPIEINKLKASCITAGEEVRKVKEEIENSIKKRKNLEQDVEREKDHLLKAKKKLIDVKNNKEYTALVAEIESTNKKIVEIEDIELQLMEEVEEKKKISLEKEAILKEEEVKFDGIIGEREAELKRHQSELLEKNDTRNNVGTAMDPEYFEKYNNLSDVFQDIAVAKLTDETCGGCFTEIPPQLAIEIRKGGEVIECPFCGRILYNVAKMVKK